MAQHGQLGLAQGFLDLLLPRMPVRAVFLAHNVINKRAEMGDFLDAIAHSPNLFTTIVAPAGEGHPTVVVWTPEMGQFVDLYIHYPQVRRLEPVIRRYYEPAARFGDIEVWRRKGQSG